MNLKTVKAWLFLVSSTIIIYAAVEKVHLDVIVIFEFSLSCSELSRFYDCIVRCRICDLCFFKKSR